MKTKKSILISILFICVFSLTFVSASNNQFILKDGSQTYIIEMVSANEQASSATLKINNGTISSSSEFYPLQPSSPFSPIERLGPHFVLTDAKSSTLSSNSTFYIGIEKKFSDTDPIKYLSFDGNNYTFRFVDSDSGIYPNEPWAVLGINNGTSDISYEFSEQSSPPYVFKEKNGLYFVLTYGYGGVDSLKATFLMFYKKTFNIVQESCTSECNTSNTTTCETNQSYKSCGNYDADSCLEWSNVTSCSSNETCENGKCIVKIIPGSNCTNECNTLGANACYTDDAYRACGNYDIDSCLEWSSMVSCNPNEICENGKCLTKPSPEPTPKDYCENIGIRTSSKYCSTKNLWVTQKSSESSCNNDFECKTNSCLNGECSRGSNASNMTIYIWAGIIILFIALVVFLMLKLGVKPRSSAAILRSRFEA